MGREFWKTPTIPEAIGVALTTALAVVSLGLERVEFPKFGGVFLQTRFGSTLAINDHGVFATVTRYCEVLNESTDQ